MTPKFNLLKPNAPVYFISPHFDDALFSAGGLISHLSKKMPVKVISVFTQSSMLPPTFSASVFIHQNHFLHATSLFRQRQAEDAQVFSRLKISPLNLGFTEAMWRSTGNIFGKLIPELGAVYPTYRWHVISGRISPSDYPLMNHLFNYLTKIIPENAIVFCPLGIGNHVDHLVVRDVCSLLPNKVIYWSDYPYNQKFLPNEDFIAKHHLQAKEAKLNLKSKLELMPGYKSQFPVMFPRGVTSLPAEKYYL